MQTITTKYLRENLNKVVMEVRDNLAEYSVFYRSLPAFKIVPVNDKTHLDTKNWLKSISGIAKKKGRFSANSAEDKRLLQGELQKRHGKNIS